jgi:hypothetical protein
MKAPASSIDWPYQQWQKATASSVLAVGRGQIHHKSHQTRVRCIHATSATPTKKYSTAICNVSTTGEKLSSSTIHPNHRYPKPSFLASTLTI